MLLQDCNTSLLIASGVGRTELCKLLLRKKADVEATDKVLEATRGDTVVICVQNLVKCATTKR